MSSIWACCILKDDEGIEITFRGSFIWEVYRLHTTFLYDEFTISFPTMLVAVIYEYRPTYSIYHAPTCIRANINIVLEVDSNIYVGLLDNKYGSCEVPGLLLLWYGQFVDVSTNEEYIGQIIKPVFRNIGLLVYIAMNPYVPSLLGPVAICSEAQFPLALELEVM